jgi:hypothetical protein
MGGACSMHGSDEKFKVLIGNLKGETSWEI